MKINTCNKDKARQLFNNFFWHKTNVKTTKQRTLFPREFSSVCQNIMGELHTNGYQYKTSVNVCSEKIMMYKIFFQVAGKPKMLANMPNAIARRKFGQGLPPVKVTLKKMSRNGKDSNLKIDKLTKNINFSLSFCSKTTPNTSKHAQ